MTTFYKFQVFLLALMLVFGGGSDAMAGKGPKPRKKPAKKSTPKSSTPGKKSEAKFFNVDIFGGPSINRVSGDYLLFQEQYYEGGNTKFPTNGSFKSYTWFTAGAQIRIAPFVEIGNGLADLSFALGGMYLQKGFTHDVLLQNKSLTYEDKTMLKETFKAQYVSTQLMVRYGRALYAEVGLNLDWFLNGVRKQDLTRTSQGDTSNAILKDGFTAQSSRSYTIPKDLMATPGLGWSFALGYNFTPMFGLRWFNTTNSKFFKDSGLRNFQSCFQATITIN